MVKLLEQEASAVLERLDKVQYKTLKPLVWKTLTQERYHANLTQMGLSTFLTTSFMEGDEALCKEFLTNYNKDNGSGMVRNRLVHTDPRTAHVVLKLPHTSLPVKDVPKPTPLQFHAMYNGPVVKVPHNGYSVRALSDPSFQEFVGFLVERFSCKVNCAYVGGEILFAAKYLWDTKACLDWAGYLSQRIQAACEKVRGTNINTFEYTQYLTELIHFHLGDSANGTVHQDQANGNGVGLELAIIEPRGDGAGPSNSPYPVTQKKRKRPRSAKKLKTPVETPEEYSVEQAYTMLGRAIEQQTRDFHARLWDAENRIRELETELRGTKAELREMNAKYQAEVQKQVECEVQNNILQQEKAVLKEQVDRSVAQQAALRQQLEMCEKERAQLSHHISPLQSVTSKLL